jgi:tetratricopeptide (TPR) repeat protein
MSIDDRGPDDPQTQLLPTSIERFLAELKRRRVFRVSAVYGAIGFAVIEVAQAIFPHVGLPVWAITLVVWLVLLGFPIALVLAWAFETSPDGIRRTRDVEPAVLDTIAAQPARSRWPIGLAGAAGGALLVAAAWLALSATGSGREDALSLPAVAPGADPGVAVLPFRTNGADIDFLAEGMVDLLSSNLDGLPGLRMIDPVAVIAVSNRYRTGDGDGALPAGFERSRAAEMGATYAISGSAVQAGASTVNLVAQAHDVASGKPLGPSVEVTGPIDRPDQLVDQLTVALVQQGGIPIDGTTALTNLNSAMTGSPDALRYYLEGEAHYRRGQYEDAIASYQRALEFDDEFARVLYRLGSAYGWEEEYELQGEYLERARGLAHELSRRDSLLVSAPPELGAIGSIDYFERFTSEFPDDVDGWTQLGESILHRHGGSFLPTSRYVEAFDHAVQLAPHYDEAYTHLFEDAFARLDSGRVYELLDRYEAANPGGVRSNFRLVADLRWGGPQLRARAAASFDSIEGDLPDEVWIISAASDLWTEGEEAEALPVIRDSRTWTSSMELWRVIQRRAFQGQLTALDPMFRVAYANDSASAVAAAHVVALHLAGLIDSTGIGRARDVLSSMPMIVNGSSLNHFWLGAQAVAAEDWDEAARESALIASEAAAVAERDSARAKRLDLYHTAFDEFSRVMRGDESRLSAFETSVSKIPLASFITEFPVYHMKYEVGKRLIERGDFARAERYFRSFDPYVVIHYVPSQYQLGRVYEGMGEPEKAREHYLTFIRWWRDPDPYLVPWRRDAEDALRRLAGDG